VVHKQSELTTGTKVIVTLVDSRTKVVIHFYNFITFKENASGQRRLITIQGQNYLMPKLLLIIQRQKCCS
jgi:hypothetical protein